MNTIIRVSLDDAERNRMACNISGKEVKRMVSREELNDFVAGCIAGAVAVAHGVSEIAAAGASSAAKVVTSALRDDDPRVIKLRAEGRNSGYIRGWIAADDRIARRSKSA